MAKKKTSNLLPKLTEIEQDLLSHIQDGYQLETDSLGGNPIRRNATFWLRSPSKAGSMAYEDTVLSLNSSGRTLLKQEEALREDDFKVISVSSPNRSSFRDRNGQMWSFSHELYNASRHFPL